MGKPFALIIEDERDIAALFRHVMDLLGFQTEIVFHGQTAVERLSNCQPDIVLLDLSLPGIPGSKILEMIRKDERLPHTKVVVITGQSHLAEGLTVQPDLILQKPVSIDQLTSLVSRISLSPKSPKAVPLKQKLMDSPTGLYNQSFFRNRIESSLKQAREIENYLFSVFLFRLERGYKKIDQVTYPWESILLEIAAVLRSILRPTDTIARFDPDTFYILIENVPNGEIATQIANRIQDLLYKKVPDIGNKIRVPIRIGILLCDDGYESPDMVLADAKYAQALASTQGDEYAKYYYQFSTRKQNKHGSKTSRVT